MPLDYEALKGQLNITDVLASYGTEIPGRRSAGGAVFRTTCPLHNGDNTQVFLVDERDQHFYCYKCHAGGDVIKFVSLIERISNHEAAKKLAEEWRLDVQQSTEILSLRQIKRQLATWRESQLEPPAPFSGQLPATVALESFRGYSKSAIAHFGLRRIPGEGWGSGIYIPIRDYNGALIGYSIRHPDGLQMANGKPAPKYLNSTGMDKKFICYGLFEDQAAIAEKGEAILVEGQFDAISMWDRGYRNVVALMGCTLSIPQAQLLMRVTTRLVLMLDGDDAGRQGMAEIRRRWRSAFDIARLTLPDGMDPDTADLSGVVL